MTWSPRLKVVVIFAVPIESRPETPATLPLSETCTVPVGANPASPPTAIAKGTGARNIEVAGSAQVVAVGGSAQQGKLRRIASRPNREISENRIYPSNSYAAELLRRIGVLK